MKLVKATITKRMPQEAYAFEEISLEIMPEGKETLEEVLQSLKSIDWDLNPSPTVTEAEEEVLEEAPKKTRKPKAAKPAPEPEPEEEEEEDENEFGDDEEEEEEIPEPPKKAAAKKPKSKATVYERGNELHKKLVGELLNEQFPGFRKDKVLAETAVAASKKMAGQDFLDSDGEVLESFSAQFAKWMKALTPAKKKA